MQILSMPQINRERGSISEPCVRDSHHQGTFVHCSQIPKQVDYYGHEEYRYIADQDTEYGIGVWPYKPCFSIKVDHCQGFQRDNIGMCKLIAQTGVADWTNQPWTWSETDHPDQFSLPVEEKIHLNNKLESRLPSIAAGMPDLFVFFKELGDIKGTFDFLKERTLSKKISGAHLSYSFGIRPFIADIKKIILKLDKWQDRIETIQKGIGLISPSRMNGTSWRSQPYLAFETVTPNWWIGGDNRTAIVLETGMPKKKQEPVPLRIDQMEQQLAQIEADREKLEAALQQRRQADLVDFAESIGAQIA
jgi:hypothetical protein